MVSRISFPGLTHQISIWSFQEPKKRVNINMTTIVSSGVRTHAPLRRPELESGALDHSAMLTAEGGLLTVGFEPTPFPFGPEP